MPGWLPLSPVSALAIVTLGAPVQVVAEPLTLPPSAAALRRPPAGAVQSFAAAGSVSVNVTVYA